MDEAPGWTAGLRDPYREELTTLSSHLTGRMLRAAMLLFARGSLRLLIPSAHSPSLCQVYPKLSLVTVAFKALEDCPQPSPTSSFPSLLLPMPCAPSQLNGPPFTTQISCLPPCHCSHLLCFKMSPLCYLHVPKYYTLLQV